MNLIPPHGEVVIRRDYILRLGATLAILFGGVGIVLATGSLPIYILVNAQIQALNVGPSGGIDIQLLESAEVEIKQIKETLGQLRSTQHSVYASDIIESVETLSSSDISFQRFALGYKENVIEHITVAGTASTRGALIDFKRALEASETFLSAEVPIADLVKDVNLPFTMKIQLSPKT